MQQVLILIYVKKTVVQVKLKTVEAFFVYISLKHQVSGAFLFVLVILYQVKQ